MATTRRTLLSGSLGAIALSACAHEAHGEAWAPAEATDAYFRRYGNAQQFAGVVLIAQGERLLFSRAYGAADARTGRPARLDTPYPLASLSKAFTAAAIVKLVQDGRLRFADPLSTLMPAYPNGGAITIDMLLRHTAGVGLVDDPDFLVRSHPLDELVAAIAAAPPLAAPGSGDYSNEGYILLAKAIEIAAGMPYERYLDQLFFRPLRLRHTARDDIAALRGRAWGSRAMLGATPIPVPRDEQPLPGASGLKSTVGDLYSWLRALKSGAIVDYGALTYPYGFGRRSYQGRRLIEQSGTVEGFGSYMAAYEDGHFAFVLSNVQSGVMNAWGEDIAALLTGAETTRPTALEGASGATVPAAYAGNFRNPDIGYPLRLRVTANRLEMTWGPYPIWRPMSQLGADEFLAMADYTRIKFNADASGLSMFGINGTPAESAAFTRVP